MSLPRRSLTDLSFCRRAGVRDFAVVGPGRESSKSLALYNSHRTSQQKSAITFRPFALRPSSRSTSETSFAKSGGAGSRSSSENLEGMKIHLMLFFVDESSYRYLLCFSKRSI